MNIVSSQMTRLAAALAVVSAACLAAATPAGATATLNAPPLVITAGGDGFPLHYNVKALEDMDGSLTIEQALGRETADKFAPLAVSPPQFGHTKSAWWLRIDIQNSLPDPVNGALEVEPAWIESIGFYLALPGGRYRKLESGSLAPPGQAGPAQRTFLFPLEFYPQEVKTVYIRVRSTGPVSLPMTFWTNGGFSREEGGRMFFFGALFGLAGLALIRQAARAWRSPGRCNLAYAAYLASGLTLCFSYNGFWRLWLFPESGWMTSAAPPVFGLLFLASAMELARSVLEERDAPWTWNKPLLAAELALVTLLAVRLGGLAPDFTAHAAMIAGRVAPFALTILTFLRMMEGNLPARRMLPAWIVTSAGILLGISSVDGWLTYERWGIRAGEALTLAGASLLYGAVVEKEFTR